jgi:16S rRNA (uracil1498-N3)-methyltransferase
VSALISVVITEENIGENEIAITDKRDIHHLRDVFRIVPGDKIRAVDGEKEYYTAVSAVAPEKILLTVEKTGPDVYAQGIRVHMALGVLKHDKMGFAVQKLAELGVEAVIPLLTRRVVVRLEGEDARTKKISKWQKIADETLKQCRGVRRVRITALETPEALDYEAYDLILVPYESEEDLSLKEALANFPGTPGSILVVIGPEGGFDPGEIALFKEKGARIVTLGKRILRAETAAVVTGGILFHVYS